MTDLLLHHQTRRRPGVCRASGFAGVVARAARMRAMGHGTGVELPAERAVEIARNSEPRTVPETGEDPTGLKPGQVVSVRPERLGTETVTGVLKAVDAGRVQVLMPG